MALLEIRDVTRTFRRRGREFAAVDHVSLSVEPGGFVAIVGRSGNGKSTLLNLIAGLLRPTSGSVVFDGRDLASLDDRVMSAVRSRGIGFVTQSHTLMPNLTVLDNVILPSVMPGAAGDGPVVPDMFDADGCDGVRPSDGDTPDTPTAPAPSAGDPDAGDGVPAAVPGLPDVIAPMPAAVVADMPSDGAARRAMRLLTALQVGDLAGCRPRELSGGEMRRVAIARALMNRPRLLIADEPTGDLDADSTATVMRLLRGVADAGTAVLMVTHDPDALGYADRVLRMDRGVLTEA
ncbi:ABC transporter ATP-binding protein [Bifidobacterium samirii]|uniref:ABC transporter ATP-binding protein n=1 Tax=Bifidobacterium samirii TaxID=2306974 RepID=A0A430FU05_9BIFI|nr:ABC transporter ATP-binding protein [Bifidobacterium samirii]RSX56557.1 ABC transporter ATP-binding protein [Bifidobacterium samirii]